MTTHSNPLLESWATPHQLPPFDLIRAEHFAPAFETLFAEHLAEIDAIAANPAAPDFANTAAAFDAAGARLTRVQLLFENLTLSESTAELQAVELAMAPKLAAHTSRVGMHEGFFARLDALYQQRQQLELAEEERRLLDRLHTDFIRTGAKLEGADRTRFAEIASRIAELSARFSQNVLADEAEFRLTLTSEAELAGLPPFLRDAAQSAARERGVDGYVITLSRSLVVPFLSYSTRRDLRETAWKAWVSRGETPGRETGPQAQEILALRYEKAMLLGYKNFADFALADRMAGTPQAVYDLLQQVWEPAKRRCEAEKADLVAIARKLGEPDAVQAWDWFYLSEKVRADKYDLDDAEIKPYFSLDAMLGAAFDCAGQLFGLSFAERHDVPLYHPDVRLFEVSRNGEVMGLFLSDNYARASKRGGAWMHIYRGQSRNGAVKLPVVVNNNNFAKASSGPTLLGFDDVRTLFHEFGHGLHGLLSNVTYNRLAGTNVPQDYVELPSQLLENWALVPEVLEKHARHVQTGEVIPAELVKRIRAAATFNQGFETVRYTACTLIDLALHQETDPAGVDIATFEATERARLGVPPEAGMNHRLAHFRHLFSDEWYAAGYYVYMWAEVLEAEAFEAFEEAGNPFDPALSDKLYRYIYSAGNSREQKLAFRTFRGKEPVAAPMLRKRGLIEA
ncbi:M3 family metallopeptidase [Silvimonas iriomotensis]|uniref:Peptidyl-dipeptidase Dcp n=1 Tax=Silvimonas iriomotensis TaxID=449662 RepID=A0ABQ2PB32_9NEIS|nr:M3 family metallopeptidase [Silvimonas iriomotensis]GGP22437.1 peptidyl-dipeptidase Dcp [Silvimonas iriomotensis]